MKDHFPSDKAQEVMDDEVSMMDQGKDSPEDRLYKYPRTPYLPWSPGLSGESLIIDPASFEGRSVVVTEKMDGENTTIYRNAIHARSVDSGHHPSRSWVKNFHAQIARFIQDGYRICGENLYAEHSIRYDELESYFYMFSVWTDQNVCLDWTSTGVIASFLHVPTPRVMYEGIYSEGAIRSIYIDAERCEGYVVRIRDSFHYDEFNQSVAKWVRPGHIQTNDHWMHGAFRKNLLREEKGLMSLIRIWNRTPGIGLTSGQEENEV